MIASKQVVKKRVTAVICTKGGKALIAGHGDYVGDVVPPPGVGLMGIELHALGHKNPKIELDNGNVIWGCQCWWGSKEKMATEINGLEIIELTSDQLDEIMEDPSKIEALLA